MAGPDAAAYLMFLKFCKELFFFTSLWALATVLPTNMVGREVDRLEAAASYPKTAFTYWVPPGPPAGSGSGALAQSSAAAFPDFYDENIPPPPPALKWWKYKEGVPPLPPVSRGLEQRWGWWGVCVGARCHVPLPSLIAARAQAYPPFHPMPGPSRLRLEVRRNPGPHGLRRQQPRQADRVQRGTQLGHAAGTLGLHVGRHFVRLPGAGWVGWAGRWVVGVDGMGRAVGVGWVGAEPRPAVAPIPTLRAALNTPPLPPPTTFPTQTSAAVVVLYPSGRPTHPTSDVHRQGRPDAQRTGDRHPRRRGRNVFPPPRRNPVWRPARPSQAPHEAHGVSGFRPGGKGGVSHRGTGGRRRHPGRRRRRRPRTPAHAPKGPVL